MTEQKKGWGYIPLMVVFALSGIALVVAGATAENPQVSLSLTSVGGAIFGASFGGFFAGLSERKLAQSVLSILHDTTHAKVSSEEKLISAFRKRWYHYSKSEMDGIISWRLAMYDFTLTKIVGQLNTVTSWNDKHNQPKKYNVEGMIRDQRLIFFIKAERGTEPVGVEIMPSMGESFHTIHCGFWLVLTWDESHSILPTIMSEKPLHGCKKVGLVPDGSQSLFESSWRDGIKRIETHL